MPDTFRFDLTAKRISKDANIGAPVALFADLETDTLYAVEGTSIKAVHGGASSGGTWKSRVFKEPSGVYSGFAWGRLTGDLTAGVVLKLYADGALAYTTPTITLGEPFRLPGIEARAWTVELLGTARVASLVVADSAEALI